MTKIRVYDLAKEAGIDSKILVADLQEEGYDVKAHNSTLEDDVADEIRKKLGTLKTKIEQKRIQSKGRTTIIRRRTTSVREEKPVVAEAPPQEELEETTPPVQEAPPEEAVATVEPVEQPAEIEEPEIVPAPEPEKAEIEPEIETTPPQEETAVKEDEEDGEEEEEKKAKPAPTRKGLARVIKKSAISLPPMEEPRAKEKRPAKPKKKGPAAPATDGRMDKPGKDNEDAIGVKGKKNKRFVKFHTDPADRDRFRKGAKRKGQADISMEDVDALGGRIPAGLKVGRGKRLGKKHKASQSSEASQPKAIKKRIKVYETISVGDLAHRMGVKSNEVIANLMALGIMATMNQALDIDTATLVATDFGYEIEKEVTGEQTVLNLEDLETGGEEMPRPPVVTVMGHVDHGKTSILDAIRKTDVAAGEAGGITQHIGAHYVRSAKGDVVFLDTPGHAAFTEMRSRGAKVTDVVVLVVAADDGVMDQTREAINHAKAANVPIVVAINKIDKDNADPGRIKAALAEYDLTPEEWGGQTIFCETSAKQNIGIEELLEQILLQAEIQELKADAKRKARGWVVEAQLHKGRGPVATILVNQGTLQVGDSFVVGNFYGKVRSLFNDKGETVKEAGPSMPVEVHGLSGVPEAGDEFIVVPDDKMAKNVSAQRQLKSREVELGSTTKISLDNLFEKLQEGEVKELRVLLRSDVQGTLEAFGTAIEKLSTEAIKVKILHGGTGTITESDVLLAAASDALIIGFNVRPSAKVKEMANKEKVDIRFYDVIYHALDDIRSAMTGMLEPTYEEEVIGSAEVRDTFHHPKAGTIAGSYVLEGKIERNAKVRILRDGVVIYTGRIDSLRRFKDDAKEVQTGYECGISVENYNDIKVGDILEAFQMKEVAGVL